MGVDSSRRTAIVIPSERPKNIRPRLVVIAGPELGRQIELTMDALEIGRAETAGLRLDIEQVSRRHAAIQRFGSHYILADLNSTNGTFVNDEKITTRELKDGDRIRIGKAVLKYSESDVEAEYHFRIFNMANLDALTGAYNKRYFDEAFRKEVEKGAREGRPFALLLFDIDFFKKINDTYGHPAGDAVLTEVAEVVRGIARPSDLFGRVGGEEFALACPETPLDNARDLAELVRASIQEHEFAFETQRIPVTSSVGVGELLSTESADDFYKRCDAFLYEAKRSGRNRVVFEIAW
jgi:diguanylate cyclase (GGDEF)-like protein